MSAYCCICTIFIGMYYIIYKITNRLNNKFYVGKHKTLDKSDGYLGSGILIDRAVKKYGKENFDKEILFECATEEEMNRVETNIVDEDFVSRDDTYNLALGGFGGASCITNNDRRRGHETFKRHWAEDAEFRLALSEKRALFARIRNLKYGFGGKLGRKVSAKTKERMSLSGKGKRCGESNGVYGKFWITDGIVSKMVDKHMEIPDGWRRGHVNNIGGKLSDEHRKKLSHSHKGKGLGKDNSYWKSKK